jgi:DedD protein
LDTATKQRLLGAAILVALVVIIVPEFLRGKPPAQADAPILLPRAAEAVPAGDDANAPLRSVTVDMRESTSAPPSGGRSATTPAPTPAPASASTAQALPDAAVAAAALATTPERSPAPDAEPTPPRASTNLPKPAGEGPWVVQLGSFALKVSAERLARELKADGYPAYVSPVKRGARELFRVRVGPFADRPAASAYYSALRAAGKDVAIVPNR